MKAVIQGHEAVTTFLLEEGADPEETTYHGQNAMHLALERSVLPDSSNRILPDIKKVWDHGSIIHTRESNSLPHAFVQNLLRRTFERKLACMDQLKRDALNSALVQSMAIIDVDAGWGKLWLNSDHSHIELPGGNPDCVWIAHGRYLGVSTEYSGSGKLQVALKVFHPASYRNLSFTFGCGNWQTTKREKGSPGSIMLSIVGGGRRSTEHRELTANFVTCKEVELPPTIQD